MRVFLSRHDAEGALALRLANELTNAGCNPIMNNIYLIRDRVMNPRVLEEALHYAKFTVCFISQDYLNSSWHRLELSALWALEENRGSQFIIPILIGDIEDAEIFGFLKKADRPHIDLRKESFDEGVSKLLNYLAKAEDDELALFISHASADEEIAAALVDLLQGALNLPNNLIRCTSLNGYRLPSASSVDERLRHEVYEARTFVGIITPRSIQSIYVLFELGARWGAGRHLAPVLAGGADAKALKGPLSNISALRCDDHAQIQQLVRELASSLGRTKNDSDSYDAKINSLVMASRITCN